MAGPLSQRNVEIRLGKLDRKTGDRLVVPGTPTLVQNMEQVQAGRYQRRPGTILLGNLDMVRRAGQYGTETLMGTSSSLYSLFDGAPTLRGAISSLPTYREAISNTIVSQTEHDMCATTNYYWHVWTEFGSGIYYSCRRRDNGAYVIYRGLVEAGATMARPVIRAFDSYVLVTHVNHVYVSGNGTGVRCTRIPIASPASPDTTVAVDIAGSPFLLQWELLTSGPPEGFDVIAKDGTTACIVGMGNPGISAEIKVSFLEYNVATQTVTASLQETTGEWGTTSAYKHAITFMGISGGLYHVCYTKQTTAGNTDAIIRYATTATGLGGSITRIAIWTEGGTSGAYAFETITGWLDGAGTQHFVASLLSSASSARVRLWYFTRTAGGSITDQGITFGFLLGGRRFSFEGADMVPVLGSNDSAVGDISSMFFLSASSMAVVSRALPGVATARPPRRAWLPSFLSGTDSEGDFVRTPAVYKITTEQTAAIEITLRNNINPRWVEAAGMMLFPGSTIYAYDGASATELGFYFRPDPVSVTTQPTGGSIEAGTYYYRFVWAWYDAKGQLHRGDPSDPYSHVNAVGSTSRHDIIVTSLAVTQKTSPAPEVFLEAYRSPKNPTDANAADYYYTGRVQNDPSVDTLALTDTLIDATLITKEKLYTLGNRVQSNTTPPPANGLSVWNTRVFAWERDFLWFSKTIQDGYGLAFSDENYLRFADRHGDIVAGAANGGRYLIFKTRTIYSISGEGPNDLGVGEFSPPREISQSLGARSSGGVISTDHGVFFQDHDSGGIWLVPPDGAPSYVGKPIEDLLGGPGGFDIVDASIDPRGRRVRFYNGVSTFVYDLIHEAWYVYTSQDAISAAVINGAAAYVSEDGDLRLESTSVWRENSGGPSPVSYQAKIKIGHCSFAGIGGYQRVYAALIVGEKQDSGDHQAVVRIGYKFTAVEDIQTIDTSAMDATETYIIEARPSLANQLATAITLTWEDDSPNNAGAAIDAFMARIGVGGGRHRPPATNIADVVP